MLPSFRPSLSFQKKPWMPVRMGILAFLVHTAQLIINFFTSAVEFTINV